MNEKTDINANDVLDEWEFSDMALINRDKTDYRFGFDHDYAVDRWRL